MGIMERLQTVIILGAVAFGFLIGQVTVIEQHADLFIVPFLLLMLYGLFLTIPLDEIKKAFLNVKFLSASTAINFIWTPIFAWALGAVFLADYPALWIGFIMLMVTPCTDWYLMFTGIARGNVALSTSILPINLILQVLLLPVYLLIFTGTIWSIPISTLVESIFVVLVIPFALAHLTRFLFRKNTPVLSKRLIPFFSSAQMIFLSLAITAMFASQGSILMENLHIFYILIIPVLVYFVINYMVGDLTGRLMKFPLADRVSLKLTILARNSPVALAIAVTAFPDEPLISLALVIGPLIELPVLVLISQFMILTRKNG
ncbi:arsenic resistance protein [Paenibacillus lemnae]|uniref:Arsenic resistance protein n=1 Tax=Paenibacillus lemnae TaxID=1330551 RepID=A0A848MBH2_PAELE|nr:arsenic resistance protein [Paenibacillus lemnae]NMO98035.1 arsenic resistance protein [Paenibacillus lemnae]